MHIDNLYKNKDILLFKQCYALEKIHGTSAHIKWNEGKLTFFSGGESHEKFKALFNEEFLTQKFTEIGCSSCVVYGEAYGGKQQVMSDTYGKELKFIVFEVCMSDKFLNVPRSEFIAKELGLEFVDYCMIPCEIDAIEAEKNKPSTQAKRNGILEDKIREGVVLRPLIEFVKNNGDRIIAKHKHEKFGENKSKRELTAEELKVLDDAKQIAEEWVTEMRLTHVLDKLPKDIGVEQTGLVIKAMLEDVLREAKGEIVESSKALKEISRLTAQLFKQRVCNIKEDK